MCGGLCALGSGPLCPVQHTLQLDGAEALSVLCRGFVDWIVAWRFRGLTRAVQALAGPHTLLCLVLFSTLVWLLQQCGSMDMLLCRYGLLCIHILLARVCITRCAGCMRITHTVLRLMDLLLGGPCVCGGRFFRVLFAAAVRNQDNNKCLAQRQQEGPNKDGLCIHCPRVLGPMLCASNT